MLVLYSVNCCVSTDAVIIIAGGGRAGRGVQLAHSKHMLHCVRQEYFAHTQTIRCVVDVHSVSVHSNLEILNKQALRRTTYVCLGEYVRRYVMLLYV